MINSKQKVSKSCWEIRKYDPYMTKRVNRNCSEEAPMLNLLKKIFKAAITDMLKKWNKHV